MNNDILKLRKLIIQVSSIYGKGGEGQQKFIEELIESLSDPIDTEYNIEED